MKILGKNLNCLEISRNLTVPDCNVAGPNKVGTGHGEQKFYFGPKDDLNAFFSGQKTVKSFFLKSDLVSYMMDIKKEYDAPSQPYADSKNFPALWSDRNAVVSGLDDIVWFDVSQQDQIQGPRGYINSKDEAYNLFRELALPNTSYIMIMKLTGLGPQPVYYWKFFVDYKAIHERKSPPLVYTYGKKGGVLGPAAAAKGFYTTAAGQDAEAIKLAKKVGREAAKQHKYRDALFEEAPFCPITGITDERLLIASHIKPFECCDGDKDGYDPQNGFLLSPLYDKLFDKGLISFTDDRYMVVSDWLSPANQKLCNVKNHSFVQKLPITPGRLPYLEYHRKHVFKG